MPFDATAWADTAKNRGRDEAPPDGSHDAVVVNTKIATKQATGQQWVVISWRALSGPGRDMQWDSMWSIDAYKQNGEPNDPGLSITIGNLANFGVDVEQITDEIELVRALETREGQEYAVRVKRNGNFTNTDVDHSLAPLSQRAPLPTTPTTPAPGSLADQAGYQRVRDVEVDPSAPSDLGPAPEVPTPAPAAGSAADDDIPF